MQRGGNGVGPFILRVSSCTTAPPKILPNPLMFPGVMECKLGEFWVVSDQCRVGEFNVKGFRQPLLTP